MQVRTILGASLLAGALLTGAPAAAAASSAPPGETYLTYVGCEGFFAQGAAPRTRINIGPGAAPLGRRSLGLVPGGPGTAAGPAVGFTSLSGADLSVMAHAPAGATGVSYVWALNAAAPGTAWHGTARLAVGAGQWQRLSAAETVYDWRLIDLATRTPVGAAGSSTPAQLAAEHGDGPGYVVLGLGCDGAQFNIDAVRSAGSVVDFEGLSLTTSIDVDARRVAAGKSVTVTGAVRDGSGRITGDPLILEQRVAEGPWRAVGDPVAPAPSGWTSVSVVIEADTELRWYRPESQYADEGWSQPVRVELATQ